MGRNQVAVSEEIINTTSKQNTTRSDLTFFTSSKPAKDRGFSGWWTGKREYPLNSLSHDGQQLVRQVLTKTHIKSIIFASKIASELKETTSYARQGMSQPDRYPLHG